MSQMALNKVGLYIVLPGIFFYLLASAVDVKVMSIASLLSTISVGG